MFAEYAQFAMAAILVAAMAIEIKTGRIPNWLVALPLLIFVALLITAEERNPLYWQIGLAVGVFVFGLVMFGAGGMGAGAVKLMTGTALFVPFGVSHYAALAFLGILFVSSFFFVQIRKFFGSEDSSWHLMANAIIPLSFSIGTTGIIAMFFL